MKKALIFSFILMFALVGNASAITWQWAGGVFDQEIFDYNNDWAPITYPNVPDHTPSPGGNVGEMFDVEGGKCGMDADYLYFAVTSSYGLGVEYDNFYYEVGDFFFGFDGMDTQFGIDYDGGGVYAVGDYYDYIPETPAGYHNNLSVKMAAGAYSIDTDMATLLGQAEGYLHEGLTENVTGDTYVVEARIAKSYLMDYGIDFGSLQTIDFRQTISCGNDFIEDSCNVIPEPTTMALLGLGLLGTGLIARRKK
jgi:hypothetical protein